MVIINHNKPLSTFINLLRHPIPYSLTAPICSISKRTQQQRNMVMGGIAYVKPDLHGRVESGNILQQEIAFGFKNQLILGNVQHYIVK